MITGADLFGSQMLYNQNFVSLGAWHPGEAMSGCILVLQTTKYLKIDDFLDFALYPIRGAYSILPDSLAELRGLYGIQGGEGKERRGNGRIELAWHSEAKVKVGAGLHLCIHISNFQIVVVF